MKSRLVYLTILTLFLSLSFHICFAETKYEPLVITDGLSKNLKDKISKTSEFPFIALQITSENNLSEENKKAILDYIKIGGTVWFYDSRIASIFGMKNTPMTIKGLETKGMEAEFGGGKTLGAAIGAAAIQGAPPVRSVRRAAIFIISIGENLYGAIENKDVIPLLQVPGQKSLVGAVKKIGKGKAIFKPLLWEKQYDGAAFQRKLIRYSKFNDTTDQV